MKLWIRSQDKMALAKFDLCILEKYEDKYMFIADHYKNMGTYKTKERALEVLDEIQDILKPRTIQKFRNELKYNENKELKTTYVPFDTFENTEIQELTTYVYEMPKE